MSKIKRIRNYKDLPLEQLERLFVQVKLNAEKAYSNGAIQAYYNCKEEIEAIKEETGHATYQKCLDTWFRFKANRIVTAMVMNPV